MKRIPLTRVVTLSPFTRFLEAGGYDLSHQLSALGIPPETMQSPESLVPLPLASELVDWLSHHEGIERFGLEVGSRTSMRDFGIFGALLCQALTLNDLIGKMIRWIPLIDSGAKVWVESRGNAAPLKLCLRHEIETGRPIADGYALFLLIDAVRMATGPDWRPRKIWLDAAAGSDLSRYEALSEARVIRDVEYIAFEIPREKLELPVVAPPGKGAFSRVSDDDLLATAPSEDVIESITQTIHASLGTTPPTIEHAAQMADTSVRTLQRRLGAAGVVYSELLDRVRFKEARTLLSQRNRAVSEIAGHLGYSDAANFTHAFHRWTGEAPSSYRRRL